MGGKLFHKPRMPRDRYLAIERDVRLFLDEALGGAYRIPRYYGDKPDFGDMDVIVASRPDWDLVRADIAQKLGATETRAVGHVFSILVRDLQTDFFPLPAEYLDSAYAFMSFNDLGNFMGRICRRFDLKFGERGLLYVYRHADDNHHEEIEVTRDFSKVCAFLGLDYAAWERGFASLDEVFEWVIASPHFSVAPYLDEETSNVRRREGTRSTVARFIDWLEKRGVEKRPTFADRRSYVPMVAAAFPEADLPARIEQARKAEERRLAITAKFNGKRVMSLAPGLEGKALGEFIVQFKRGIGDQAAFEEWVLATPVEEIDQRVRAEAKES